MADKVSMALAELVRKAEADGDVDSLMEGVRVLSQALMEMEVAQHLGAKRYERSGERSGQRVALIDRDQGQHLSRVFDFYPPAVDDLVLGEDSRASLPEAVNIGEANRLTNYCAGVTSVGRLIQAGPGKGGGNGSWRTKRSGCAA